MNYITKDQITDTIGTHLESFIAIFVAFSNGLRNFSVGNQLKIAGDTYRYQFVVSREGQELYREMGKDFEEAGMVKEDG